MRFWERKWGKELNKDGRVRVCRVYAGVGDTDYLSSRDYGLGTIASLFARRARSGEDVRHPARQRPF